MLFFWRLGETFAEVAEANPRRHVIAAAIPTRAYAAPLASASFCLRTYRPAETPEYFNYLATLPNGTVLRRRRGDRWQYVIFQGVDPSVSGPRFIRVQTARGRPPHGPIISSITEEHAASLYVSVDDKRDVQLPQEEGIGQLLPVAKRPGLLSYWFSPNDMYDYSMTISYDCAIIGALNVLEQELLCDVFAIPQGSSMVVGALHDLVRAKRLANQGEGYRSRLFPDRDPRQIGRQNTSALHPKLVIFDGARAFLKWRLRFPQSHWLIILDRTEYDFSSGVAQVLADSATGQQVSLGNLDIPAGIEVLAYQED